MNPLSTVSSKLTRSLGIELIFKMALVWLSVIAYYAFVVIKLYGAYPILVQLNYICKNLYVLLWK